MSNDKNGNNSAGKSKPATGTTATAVIPIA